MNVVEGAVFVQDLRAGSKAEAILKMTRALLHGTSCTHDQIETIGNAMLDREVNKGTTGVGLGFALPHVKSPYVDRLHFGWFFAVPAVEFDSLDKSPCDIFFCLVSYPDRPGDHLRALESAARLGRMISELRIGGPPRTADEWRARVLTIAES